MDSGFLEESAARKLEADLESKIEELVRRAAAGVRGSGSARVDARALADALAAFLPQYQPAASEGRAPDRHGLPRHRLRKVVHFIDENLAADVSVSRLASVAGMSPHYFAEMFRRSTGCTPHQYVLRKRIERAKHNLSLPGDVGAKVIDAALEAGFQNPSHFARVFRRFVGMSPSRFRSGAQAARNVDAQAASPVAVGKGRATPAAPQRPGRSDVGRATPIHRVHPIP